MSEAKNNQVTRSRSEIHTGNMPIGQKDDIIVDGKVQHGESLIAQAGDIAQETAYLEALAFMEEPVTIRIEENSRSDFPETHVPAYVNGKAAEVFDGGKWVPMGWLPIGYPLITKRKYVEVLARAKSDNIKTQHEEATVERPRNTIKRSTVQNYPLSIIEDRNPKGHEWLSRILMGH